MTFRPGQRVMSIIGSPWVASAWAGQLGTVMNRRCLLGSNYTWVWLDRAIFDDKCDWVYRTDGLRPLGCHHKEISC